MRSKASQLGKPYLTSLFGIQLFSLIAAGCSDAADCDVGDIRITNDQYHVALIKSCTSGTQLILFKNGSGFSTPVSIEEVSPQTIATSRDKATIYVAGPNKTHDNNKGSEWKIIRKSIDGSTPTIVVRRSSRPIRSLISTGLDKLVYQAQINITESGRPIFQWQFDDLVEGPRSISSKTFGYLLSANPIANAGILYLAPQTEAREKVNALVWESFFPETPQPTVAVRSVSDQAYGVACNSNGSICTVSSTTTPAPNTSRFRSEISVYGLNSTCSSGPLSEHVSRLSISADGRYAAYVGSDLVTGKGGQVNPHLVFLELNNSRCTKELWRTPLTGRN